MIAASLVLVAAALLPQEPVPGDAPAPQDGSAGGAASAEAAAPTGSARGHPQGSARFHTTRPSEVRLPLPDEEEAFTFVVFGDRTGGPAEGIRILARAVDEVNLLHPDLVMTVGDLVQGYGETEAWLAEMREYREIMDRLECAWFPVAGNHDVYWRGEGTPPPGEHEGNYETHFGPLWYAFAHKNSWFVVLYSDEGDPETGRKDFRDPAAQRMSAEQLAWLESTLERAAGAAHVFVFLHHPRWIGGDYGDDWKRVHAVLAAAENVTAVFAGHVHRMRYDERDDVRYYTLATVGGGQSGAVPEAGYLHQYHVVTVRPDHVHVAAFSVGSAFAPERITGTVSDETLRLAEELVPRMEGAVRLEADLSAGGSVVTALENPVSRPIEVSLVPDSADPYWRFTPDHRHVQLAPGERTSLEWTLGRTPGGERALDRPAISVRTDYLAEGWRVPIPPASHPIPLDLRALAATDANEEDSVELDGVDDHLRVEHGALAVPDGPLTVECWFEARAFRPRQGLVTKTESSEYGLFVGEGRPAFFLHLDGRYAVAEARESVLSPGRWHHLAGVFDGGEARLYLDGRLCASAPASGARTTSELPLVVGADVGSGGGTSAHFEGRVDEVRVSTTARYAAPFEPERRFAADEDTAVLLHLDRPVGPWYLDASGRGAHALLDRR